MIYHISNGRPVLVDQWSSMETKISKTRLTHYRVIIGYDMDKQMIYVRDPRKNRPGEYSFSMFNELWDVPKVKNWMLIVY